ncbi:MAG: peptide MFS transporter [Henriciella sp.]|nr:peptide MFS transporter [Henriciella sp.]
MRGLLLLYLVQHFLFGDREASIIYGGYIALVYIMSIFGGVLSDRYLGQRKAVTYGAILLVLGHFGMAFEGSGSKETLTFAGNDNVIEDVGRDDNRKLYIDYEGQSRRIVFDSYQYLMVGSDRYEPIDDEGQGDYVIQKNTRGLVQNICAFVGLGCAGPAPSTELVLSGTTYPISFAETDSGETEMRVSLDGVEQVAAEFSESDILVLPTADENKTADTSEVLTIVADGTYETSVEKQQIFVNILFLSLALIIAGVGFLKPNISTIVGDLYEPGDERRDSGFTIFYMGINLGSFLATWSCGILGIVYGWAYGFGLAGIGMLAGLIVFQWGQKYLGDVAEPPNPEKLKQSVLGPINIEWACYLGGLALVIGAMSLLFVARIIGPRSWIIGIVFFVGFILYSFLKLQGVQRTRMWAALYFALAQIPFWSLFEQAGSSLTLVTSRLVDTTIFGIDVPTPVFQSLNAGFIFIFAPIVAWLWIWLGRRGWEPSTPVKFAIGVFGAGLGYMVLVSGMNSVGASALTPVFFIFAIYWVHTMAELTVSPVGLSAMTKLAPARLVGFFMAAWFVYSGIANALSGVIAAAAGAETVGGQIVDVAAAKAGYIQVFSSIGYIGMGIGVVMLLIAPIVKSWMRESEFGVDSLDDEYQASGEKVS